jgi:hypothetical protein
MHSAPKVDHFVRDRVTLTTRSTIGRLDPLVGEEPDTASKWTEVRDWVGEGGLELRLSGFSTVRSDPGNADLAGLSRTTML